MSPKRKCKYPLLDNFKPGMGAVGIARPTPHLHSTTPCDYYQGVQEAHMAHLHSISTFCQVHLDVESIKTRELFQTARSSRKCLLLTVGVALTSSTRGDA